MVCFPFPIFFLLLLYCILITQIFAGVIRAPLPRKGNVKFQVILQSLRPDSAAAARCPAYSNEPARELGMAVYPTVLAGLDPWRESFAAALL